MFGDSEFFNLKNAHTLYTMNTQNGVWGKQTTPISVLKQNVYLLKRRQRLSNSDKSTHIITTQTDSVIQLLIFRTFVRKLG